MRPINGYERVYLLAQVSRVLTRQFLLIYTQISTADLTSLYLHKDGEFRTVDPKKSQFVTWIFQPPYILISLIILADFSAQKNSFRFLLYSLHTICIFTEQNPLITVFCAEEDNPNSQVSPKSKSYKLLLSSSVPRQKLRFFFCS